MRDNSDDCFKDWASTAATRAAVVRQARDGEAEIHTATVDGLNGPWGTGASRQAAVDELSEALEDWITLKISHGDPWPVGIAMPNGRLRFLDRAADGDNSPGAS